ncbi:hypothetical protein PPL_09350 [Heterostelium album PN500]|uniref:EGF-like domain-containing protein n=1 Tax=Heterostelium pallidum (strain ATCC 26659 / Pp 5 / PN500) TaxID=670386 RepID=D3BLB8_HETP5|nr:hypothetical protein PPL_09350 [Heterostelium album PN500]EFA77852.1 hypothetical protein PPL_09350 [Heterostelium album PN500]|eukprot:XP_020429980.1 hypothetical protein PPL_09350 [Heterostelium album PN500]
MYFTLDTPSAFRFYVAPHVVDVDIWLYPNSGANKAPITHSADATPGADEVIYADLPAGDYKVRLLFFSVIKAKNLDCPTLTIEAAITPTDTIKSRTGNLNCPAKSTFPNPQFNFDKGTFRYDSDVDEAGTLFNVIDTIAPGRNNITFFQQYPFTLPKGVISTDKWGIEITMGFHFLTGGSLGLLIQDAETPAPTSFACIKAGNCTIGVHTTKDHSTLKTVVTPGDYILYLYDQTQEKDASIMPPCTPFSLQIDIESAHETETILNCNAQTLPDSFNAPGYIDDLGYLYYDEDVFLDLVTGSDNVSFTIKQQSYARVYIPSHRVDIDVQISNSTGKKCHINLHFSFIKSIVVMSSFKWGGEEEITGLLEAGTYNFKVLFFGKNIDVFCDTFSLEFAIAPVTDYTELNYCDGITTNISPDLSGIQDAIDANKVYNLNTASPVTYQFMFNGQSSQATVTNQTFTVSKTSYLYVEMDSNFILGDMRIAIVSVPDPDDDNVEPTLILGDHSRNSHHLFVQLENGTYTLAIMTGLTSKNPTFLPPCILYSLKVSLTYKSDPCFGNLPFPTNLNTPGYLLTSTSIHLTDEFLVPPITLITASQNTAFTVTIPSIFRAFVEDASIDIDITLYEGKTKVAWSNNFNGEESLEYVVQPDKQYRLQTSFYHWPFVTDNQACYTYQAALSITPTTENPKDKCTSILPPANFIPDASLEPVRVNGTFRFTQVNQTFSQDIAFSVPTTKNGNTALFRAILNYDFVWNDMAIALKKSDQTVITYSSLGYNRADILPRALTPGDYILTVYEPMATNANSAVVLNNCVDFTLDVAIQMVDDTQVNQDTIVCDSLLFPQTFNSIGYMSALTDGGLSFQQKVLVDVLAGNDIVKFTLAKPSLLRIYVPFHPTVDVDFTLTVEGGKTPIDYARGSGEELIYDQLAAGNYIIKFTYYGQNGPLPQVEDCTYITAFISIEKVDNLLAIPSITTACPNTATLPTQIVGNQNYSQVFYRATQFPLQPMPMTFSITGAAYLNVSLQYNDLVTSMMMKLNSTTTINGKPVVKTLYPLYQGGQALFSELLAAGTYQLTVYDKSGAKNPILGLVCSSYQLSYYLNTTTPDVTPCDTTNLLPVDLFSTKGGSLPYGGPQNAAGEIVFRGSRFFLSKDPMYKHNRIAFMVPTEPVYMRLYAETSPNNDIDFFVYKNASDPASLIYSSYSSSNVESTLWRIEPQATPYTLDVNFMRINNKQTCNTLHFEWAIETVKHLQDDMLCPSPMPNEVDQVPPDTIEFQYGKDVNIGSDGYLFSSARINGNVKNDIFRYRMSLEVPSTTMIYAEVGFDFLDNDMDMILYSRNQDGSTTQLSTGTNTLPRTTDTAYNFLNIIQYNLTTGNYFLDITENMKINSFNITNACHFFSFHLVGQSFATGMPPRVLGVLPPGGWNLNPNLPITVNVRFSEQVFYNGTQSLLDYITSKRTVLLTSTTTTGLTITPSSAALKRNDKTTLVVSFFPVNASSAWKLSVDASDFVTTDNEKFSDENTTAVHLYNMFVCQCSNHGDCLATPKGDFVCQCNDPWTGKDCSKCKAGYHGVGNSCAVNVPCAPNNADCNGHGRCNADEGYPECQCTTGYTTTDIGSMCSSCDYGYTGYPNCTMSDDDRGTLCIAPLLPVDLNSTEYLAFNNRVHIQDNYYLDINTGSHSTLFLLKEQSVLRVYTEPHRADIDLWLYSVGDDGKPLELIDRSITFGHEEVIFKTLEAGPYVLQFKYYLWDKNIKLDCETFNLELSIDTTANLANDMTNWPCGKASLPPANTIPSVVTDDYTYSDPGTLYSIPYTTSKDAVYLWNTTFTVKSAKPGQVAIFDAIMGYQFLQGDLSLVLQTGFGDPKCKGGDQTGITGCVFGDNEVNRNLLHATLQPGNYTLFVYAPDQMYNMQCALFDLFIDINFVYDDESFFNCDGDILPASLDSSEFINNDYLHIQDTYLMNTQHNTMNFTLRYDSVIRIVAEQDKATINITLYNLDQKINIQSASTIFEKVVAGNYQLEIDTDYVATSTKFCPLMNLEIAIEPATNLIPTYPPNCPSNNQDVLPQINIRIPYIFENATTTKGTYYSFGTKQVIAMYSLTTTQILNLYTAVASDFLRGDLRVNLYRTTKGVSKLFVSGFHDYNYNSINVNLDPGTYIIKIERISTPRTVTGLDCVPFEYELNVLPLAMAQLCPGEHVPLSLNSIRFLGVEGRMHYESSNFVVPYTGNMFSKSEIPFQVPVPSIMRVYTSPNLVDVDIKIVDPSTNQVVVSGSNGINSEESFITSLQKNYPYLFVIQYWRWGKNVPTCNNFNMEIAIAPATPLDDVCPGAGQDFWPPDLPSTLPASFYYNSIDSNNNLFYQQETSGLASHAMTFTVTKTSNFHAQVGYDFLTGDLSLKLVPKVAGQKTTYGVVRPNRNMLDIVGLAPGQYTLYIYESYQSLKSIMGCSFFNFEILIEQAGSIDQADGFLHILPPTLDTYALLKYNNRIHLQGEYQMYDGVPSHNQLTFTLTTKSLVRVQASILPVDESDTYNTVMVPAITLTTQQSSYGAMTAVLTPSGAGTQYILAIGQPALTKFNNATAVDLELVIQPFDQVAKEIDSIPYSVDCNTLSPAPVLSNTNSYMFNDIQTISAEDMAKDGNIISIPFSIQVPSLFYAQIGFQFLLADLNMEFQRNDNPSQVIYGKSNRNVVEINAMIQPGDYTLLISTVSSFPSGAFKAHCTPYHLTLIINDASSSTHTDCSLFDLTPWDLSSLDGGSKPFGGPIDGSGTLNMFGNTFLIPQTRSTLNIAMLLKEQSLINVYTKENTVVTIDYDVYDNNQNMQSIVYNTGSRNNNQRSALFMAGPIDRTDGGIPYTLNMQYNGRVRDMCPSYEMQVVIKPMARIYGDLACPQTANPMPSSVIVPDKYGSATEYVNSFFSGDYLARNTYASGFRYNVSFSITRYSHVEAMFSYYSDASNFLLFIYQKVTDKNNVTSLSQIGVGDWSSQYTTGLTTLTQTLINPRLRPGDYVLVINHPPLAQQIVNASIYGDLCFPFLYSLTILDVKTVYIGSVVPASAVNLSPNKALPLSITFSEPLYNSNKALIGCNNGTSLLKKAFYLSDNQITPTFYPTNVVCTTDDALTWTLTFSSAFGSSKNYLLGLMPGYLFDDSGANTVLPPLHQYSTIDTTCSGNGAFVDPSCQCKLGYVGTTCNICDQGYMEKNKAGQVICIKNPCTSYDICGCLPGTAGTNCTPIGACSADDTGNAICHCNKAYSGNRCQTCNVGYKNFPYCTPNFNCEGGCGKGSCDHTQGICVCPSNYEGENCQNCAPGYSGGDCKKNGSSAIVALEVIAGLVAAALVIGLAAWYIRHRYRSGVARYKMLPKFEIEDDGQGSRFPGLYDSDEESNSNNNNHSINSGGGKQHVFSFAPQSTSVMDDSDDDQSNNNQNNSIDLQSQKSKLLFDM